MTPLTILIVDDDAVDREVVRRTMRGAGLDAVLSEAATAAAALEALEQTAYDCVLLDFRLPDADGLSLLQAIREREVDVPVIALTGHADQQTAVAMMKAGAADYLAKSDLGPETLQRAIRHALQVAAGERERRQLLAREQAALAEARAANRAKDEFLATLSHELRTPLNAILGWSHLLMSGTLDPRATPKAIETIQRNARLQAKLIDDLLDISRIVTGKLTIERKPVSLAGVIAAAVESQRPAAAAAGIELRDVPPAAEGTVTGDAARLQQVVTNLLSNAIKFTPQGGWVQVSTECAGTTAVIQVTDTGTGIAPDFLPFVFEQFRQGDASLTRRHGGLGLGLAIVRTLVELHGGTVGAESPGHGAGSTFRVTLPLAKSAELPEARPEYLTGNLSGIHVLVVDDDDDSRTLLATMLQTCGATTTVTASAPEALAAITVITPDLMLSDLAMPGQDGFSLVAETRRRFPELPAVAISACASPEDRSRALAAGFREHLAKPFDLSKLVSTVRRICRRKSLSGLAAGARRTPS